jgi:amino acid adenylation domain-containing protein
VSDLSSRLAELSPKQRELLLRQLEKRQVTSAPAPARIPRQPRTGQPFPVSFSQLREWILDQLEPGSAAYNIPGATRIEGPFHPRVYAAALNGIIQRHEVLRTTFSVADGEPVQVVTPELRIEAPVIDLEALPEAAREIEAARRVGLEQQLPFDLARGPLLRSGVVRLGPRDHIAFFTMHHIISDGWSVGVFYRELATLYEAFAAGRPSPLPELPVQYADFAVWQREWLQGEVLDRHLDFWRGQLAGAPARLELPTDRPRPAVQTFRGGSVPFALPADLGRAIRALAQAEGASPFMVLLAALQVLLARWSGQDDISVGTYTGSRGRAELEDLIGFFINTLVLRTDLADGPGFRALLRRVRETTLGAFAHQDLPFEKLLDALRVERDLSHTPLFQVLLVLQNFPARPVDLREAEVRLTPITGTNEHVNFDLSLWLNDAGDAVSGLLQYNRALFDASTVERLARQLRTLLEAVVADPEAPVHELPLLDDTERAELAAWSGGRVPARTAETVPARIFAQAERTPEAVAVETESVRLTYAELVDRAGRLAAHLRGLGVGPESRVGVRVERSPELIVGLLGVLAAGGAYVPLDPALPAERLAGMVEDAGVEVVLGKDSKDLNDNTKTPRGVSLSLLSFESLLSLRSLESFPSFDQAAYLIYTSGSTGRPKGVVVEHRSLAAYVADAIEVYGLEPGERALQFASIGFDTSAEEIWPALVSGATLVLRSDEMIATVPQFVAALDRLGITLLNLPTAYWHELAAGLDGLRLPESLRLTILGGEKAMPERLEPWWAAGRVRVVNTYGPTEATIVATRFEPAVGSVPVDLPIGTPIAGARVWVADRRLQLVPKGVAGELLIGGAGLARGYLGRPDQTAAAFVPDPWGSEPGARLYRSGDRVRFRPEGPEGALEFLGRVDQQLKIRGFRVEPGEVENALTAHPDVRAAVAGARPDASGAPRLVAWVVLGAGTSPNISDLRRWLAGRLPEPMIPSAFVLLEELPQTPSGKIDRRALPEPESERPRLEREYVAPEGPVEEALAEIWAEVLGLDRVGVSDDFFELGGHSLLATQVVTRIREQLQVDIPLIALFQMPTLEQLAVVVEEAILDRIESLEEDEVKELL